MATAKRESILAALATRLGATRNPYPSDYDELKITSLLELSLIHISEPTRPY